MDFDEILEHVGGFGRYQKRVIAMMVVACVCYPFALFSPVFQSYEPDHWCATPEVDNYNCSDVDIHDEEGCSSYKKYITVPHTITDANETVFSRCTKYSEVLTDDSGITETVDCDAGWNYATTGYERSIVTDFDLVCGKQIFLNIAHAVCFVGVSLGSLLFGIIADKLGRVYAFYLAMAITGTVGVLLTFSPNITVYLILRAIIGVAAQNISTLTALIATEAVSPDKRVRAGFLPYIGVSAGCIMLIFIAYLIRNWRVLQLVLSLPAAMTLFFIPFLHRSPRWLLSTGRNEAASKVVRRISVDNRGNFPEKLFSESQKLKKEIEANEPDDATMGQLLRRPILLGRTFVLIHNWFLVNFVYLVFYLYSGSPEDVYVSFGLAAFAELVATVFGLLVAERVNRKKVIVPATFVSGVSLVLIAFLEPPYSFIFIVIGKFAICAAFNTTILYTTELYPTKLRGTTGGICNGFGRISGFVCPMFLLLGERWKPLPLFILGIWAIVACLLFLPLPETKGKNLPTTIHEAEQLGRESSSLPTEDPEDVDV